MKYLVKTKLIISCTGEQPIKNGWSTVENSKITDAVHLTNTGKQDKL